MEEKEYLTQEKFDELTNELNHLQNVRRKEIAQHLEYAKSLGDLSENAEYHEARDEQASIEERISQLEFILKRAEIVHHKKGDVVEVGSTISVKKGTEEPKEYVMVSPEESDIALGKISYRSPLGEAMIGKKKGDVFKFETPKGEMEYTIVSVK